MKMAPICLSDHFESNGMQHDLLFPDLWSNFDLDLLRSNWVSFDPSRREKHNGGKIVALGLVVGKLLQKKHLCKQLVVDLGKL